MSIRGEKTTYSQSMLLCGDGYLSMCAGYRQVHWPTKPHLGRSALFYIGNRQNVSEIVRCSNHGSFFTAQLAATQMFLGDKTSAIQTLTSFFQGSFLDQIASSGEQPMECVRTRPWHYRNFNLEALIVSIVLLTAPFFKTLSERRQTQNWAIN